MKIEHIIGNIRYTLSNELLKEGDNVYPIGIGRYLDDNSWIMSNLNFNMLSTDPQTIVSLNKDRYDYKVITNIGHGSSETFFKIEKAERYEFSYTVGDYVWVEISDPRLDSSYKSELIKINQLPQTQISLSDQLKILKPFANKLGLYDAADYISDKK
jgi:hypothetical protein